MSIRWKWVFVWGIFFGSIGLEVVSAFYAFKEAWYLGLVDVALFAIVVGLVIGIQDSPEFKIYLAFVMAAGLILAGTVQVIYGGPEMTNFLNGLGISLYAGVLFELMRRALRYL